jgi:hypothetical protein
MTVINGIEIDANNYKPNEIKLAIYNNEPIEEKLNIIVVISNPCLYAKRYKLFNEFVNRIEAEENKVRLFIVEMIYNDQQFIITNKNNKNHLQVKTDTPLWHKENMINLAVKHLLPSNYKAFAWVDADIEFENVNWALDTLKILNGSKDVVQLFSHCIDMTNHNTNLSIFNGFGYSFIKNKKYTKGSEYWHPGFDWAITRKAYEKIGGLYDKGILGSGDNIMALSFINKCIIMNNINYTDDYNNSMTEFQEEARKLRLGYTPGVIRHNFHGAKCNRQYTERWQILIKHKFSPILDITYDKKGCIICTNSFTDEFKNDILNYFKERKEDDC